MTVVASNFARKENELYETERWATEALLRHLPVDGLRVWEPAAGNHKMADVLREFGASVVTSDIATYDRIHDYRADFLYEADVLPPFPLTAIITNPPYGKGNREAVKFCELALERCSGHVAMLLTAKFDFGKTRVHLFRDNPRFIGKINLIDRIQWFPGDTSGTEDHAWYVWGPDTYPTKALYWEGRTISHSSGTSSRQTDMTGAEPPPSAPVAPFTATRNGVADGVTANPARLIEGAPAVVAPSLSEEAA